MNRYRIFFLTFLILQSILASSQTFWRIENEHGDEILLTLEVNKEKNSFEAYSRKDALKDLAGIFTYALAKAAGKLKYPEIVYIEGKNRTKNDSLFLNGTFNYFDKQFLFSASVSGTSFDGKYLDNRGNPHRLTGIKVFDSSPIRDYSSMITAAFSLTEQNLVNPLWLKSDEWLDFKKKVNNLKSKISDDYELAATYFWLGKKLPFSPYEINKARPKHGVPFRKKYPHIRELTTNSALLEAHSLPANQQEMDSIAVIVNIKGYRNLIIDLRGNNRINPFSANILINYLSDQRFNSGIYLTRKWYDHHSGIPLSRDYQKLFNSFNESDLRHEELNKTQGYCVTIIPGEKTFKGKVYLLTDSKTSKVSEMLTYVLKSRKIATIVGQKTGGLTVLAGNIKLNSEYDLILPECEFYTAEGESLNKIGIEPDISKSGDEVMKYILSTL